MMKGTQKTRGQARIAMILATVLAVIAVAACAVSMSRYSYDTDVKVRYDGQTYAGSGSSGYNSGYGGSHIGTYGTSKNEMSAGITMDAAPPVHADMEESVLFDAETPSAGPAGDTGSSEPAHGSKLAWSYAYEAESEDYDGTMSALDAWLEGCGGYVTSISTDARDWDAIGGGSSNTVRRSVISMRVPSGDAAGMRGAMDGFGAVVTGEDSTMEDMTQAYTDARLQKSAYEAEYAKLLELLPQADSVSETIEIQDRLSTLNYMIQSYDKQMELIDRDVDYSRVSLTLYEVKHYSATIQKFRFDLGERMAEAFAEFLYSMPEFLFILAYLAIGGLLAVALLLLFVRGTMAMRRRHGAQQIEILDRRGRDETNKDVQT